MPQKITIGISSCLLGEAVRYDGQHQKDQAIIDQLGRHFQFKSICPEMSIGLGVPREPIHLIEIDNSIRCRGTTTSALDVTDKLSSLALQHQQEYQRLSGYIFKRGSPSCGISRVKLIKNNQLERTGIGIYARQWQRNFPNMPIAEESQLYNSAKRAAFIAAVIAYHQTVTIA